MEIIQWSVSEPCAPALEMRDAELDMELELAKLYHEETVAYLNHMTMV